MDDSGLSIGHNSSSRKIFLKTANANRLTVREDGRVGIGTTTPDSLLHLESSSGDTVLKIEADIDNNAEGDNPIILFAQDGGSVQGSVGLNVDNNLLIANQWENNDSDIVFNAFNVERMRIKGSGNVGIGTASPSAKLDVAGSANISSNLTVAGSLSVGGTTQFTSNDPKVVDQNLIIEDHTLGDTGSDWSVQQGLVVHQTGASATENARKGFVGLNWENASYYPVMRIGPDDSTAWDYNVMISSHAGLGLPYGTSSQRPITNNTKARTKSGGNGLIRYNTTTKLVEVYTDQGTGTARWEPISCPPVGGTYIQVKNSTHPGTLWGGTVWVSSDVPAGAFVRQEGGKAAAFGHSGVQGQQIMQHDHKSNEYSSSGDSIRSVRAGTRERTHQRRKTAYTTGVLFGGGWDDEGLGTSVGSENRPPNATVKFWRRTG